MSSFFVLLLCCFSGNAATAIRLPATKDALPDKDLWQAKQRKDRWVYYEHFSRAGGKTMDLNAFLNGLRGYGPYNENEPWMSRAMDEDIRWQLKSSNARQMYEAFSKKGTNYISNEDGPVDFLGLQDYVTLKKITMLRKPDERIQSLSLHGILPGYPRSDNEYVRRLIGDASGRRIASINRTHLEQAKKTLSTFDAVLLFEHFERSYDILRCKLDWCVASDLDGHLPTKTKQVKACLRLHAEQKQAFLMEIEKARAQDLNEPNETQLMRMHAANTQFDRQLYQFAEGLHKQQLAQCGYMSNALR